MKKGLKSFSVLVIFISLCLPAFSEGKTALDTFNKAAEYEQDENYYLASQYYLETVDKNPAFSDAWFNLANCSYRLGEFDLALQYLETAEKYEKENSRIQNLKGMIYICLGKIDEGKTIFNQILEKYPNDVDAHFGLAEIELYQGRYSGAEQQYSEALKRQNTNRKALLSLALVCADRKKFDEADKFLHQALSYYSGESEVHYLAAVIAAMKGDYKTAEKQARISVEVNGDYEKGYNLLSSVLYLQGRYNEVVDLCDFLISRDRKNSYAWYIKGIALEKSGNLQEAIDVWSSGLEIKPQDELMRFEMELKIRDILPIEDSRRSYWAKFHLNNAKQYASRYDGLGAVYEYQRALLLDPMNYDARIAYANMLELNGMHELYLEQLKFIQEHNFENLTKRQQTDLTDKIEAYDDLLINTLGKKWDVEPFYLDKIRWNIAVFYEDNNSSFVHADTNRLLAQAASDIFSGVAITSVKTQVTPVSGYGEAFNNARAGKFDYFVILSLDEGQNDLTLSSVMYSARTGLEVTKDNFYSTGNNRLSTVLRRFRNSVLEKLTVRGKILKRNGKTVLVDLGKSENIVKDARFKIIRKDQIRTADKGAGLYFKDSDVLGELVITEVGEEISEAVIENHGFYDRINEDDEIVLVSMPEQKTANDANGNAIDNVPAADLNGNAVIKNNVKGEELVNEIKQAVETPSIIDMLRNIY